MKKLLYWARSLFADERIRAGSLAIGSNVKNDNVSTRSNLSNFQKEFP